MTLQKIYNRRKKNKNRKLKTNFMSEHLNAQHDEGRQWICIVPGGVYFFLKIEIPMNLKEQNPQPPTLSPRKNKYRHRHRCRKQQSVAGADLKQTEINYVSMREPKKILGERKILVCTDTDTDTAIATDTKEPDAAFWLKIKLFCSELFCL